MCPVPCAVNPVSACVCVGEKVPAEAVVFPWEALTPFQRLMLIKVLLPASLTAAVHTFVLNMMGQQFIAVGHIDLREMFEESNAKTPLIFLLSPGQWLMLCVHTLPHQGLTQYKYHQR